MPLRDLVYVDEKRLDSYVEHFASAKAFDAKPVYKVSASLSGVGLTAERQQIQRQRTQPEKIELLLEYLKKHHEVEHGRIQTSSYFNHPPEFRIETCSVVNVFIPSLRPRDTGSDALTLWVSDEGRDNPSRLFLLQDFRKSDEAGFGARSAYSSLLLIYEYAISRSRKYNEEFVAELRSKERSRVKRRGLGQAGGKPGIPSELQNLNLLNPEGIEEEVDKRVDRELGGYFPLLNPLDAEIQKRFAVNPVSVLKDMGAQIGGRKDIETLYRVREVHMERIPGGESFAIVTFGYPIFVSA